MNEWKKCYAYIKYIDSVYIYILNIFQFLKKIGNPAICDGMEELGGDYTRWNKPDKER